MSASNPKVPSGFARAAAFIVLLVAALGLVAGCNTKSDAPPGPQVGSVAQALSPNGDYCTVGTTCTSGTCTANKCVPTKNAGVACTNDAQCLSGKCNTGTNLCYYCGNSAARNCNDGKSCTVDSCTVYTPGPGAAGTSCTNIAAANGAPCISGGTTGRCEASACCTAGCGDDGAGTCTALASETATACGAAGAVCASCDDGLGCTTDTCSAAGACNHALNAGQCLIGGVCYPNGAINPGNSCQVCNTATSTSAWSSVSNGTACAGGRCESGSCCTTGCGNDGTGTCVALASETATSCGAIGSACASCNDGVSCTTDTCNTATGTCSNTLSAGNCLIAGTCYTNGTANPTNACQACTTATSTTTWTNKSNGTACTGGRCETGSCCTTGCGTDSSGTCTALASETVTSCGASGAACTSCDDGLSCTTDSCGSGACSHVLVAGNCLIGGVCYANGTANPANACQICNTATSTSAWSNKSNGTACTGGRCESGSCCTTGCGNDGTGTCTALASETATSCGAIGSACASCSDGISCTTDTCNTATGTCSNTLSAGNCLIAGTCYTNGTANPTNACQACTTATSTTSWTNKSNGTACTGGRCESGSCCTSGCGSDSSGSCTALASESVTVCGASGAACTTCDDGNVCTSDSCGSGACSHSIPSACQNGLTGNYYNDASSPPTLPHAGSAVLTRVDSTINFNWAGSPGTGVNSDHFSVTWTGQVLADTTGTYTFETNSDDGIYLWVNGTLINANSWRDQGATLYTGTISLVAGTRYDVKIEYYENTGGAVAGLLWETPGSGSFVTIPSDHLFATTGTCTPCDDGNACTADSCGVSSCNHAKVVDGTACPGGTCTSGSCCSAGCVSGSTCVAYASQTGTQCGTAGAACASCDDGNPCTVDACSGSGTCTHTPGNAGTVCRASAGTCDVAETCNGTSATCPADVVAAAGTTCRAAAGECDVAETCDGTNGACPTDGFQAINVPCTDDGNACTYDYCPGNAATCSHPSTPACTNGLTVTYYDNIDFTGPNVNRVDGTVDFDWGNGSPDSGIGPDTFSARWTGQVLADFSETYTFETEADDGVRLWVNNVLLVDDFVDQGPTKTSGTITLVAGQRYDIKMDYYEDGGGAVAHLRWSSPSTPYEVIPQDHLFAGGDLGLGGMAWITGSDNGTGDPYQVWRVSNVPGTAPVNATPESANNWGLGNAVMMVPAFSPDGKKLVFIDGDSGGGAGWRKGLSTFDFDETGKAFSNRRSIRNTWPNGDVMKWPVWEPDSRSIIFQTSTPTELCTTCDGKTGYRYGNMAPTNYYGVQGLLWSIDSSGPGTAVQLTNLNTGERPADANKSYQPTMLPVSVGGYRWIVFTSTRPYGNTLNPPGISTSCTASQLWVAALDDTTAGATDRSHPAFWLPNQNLGDPSQPNYINERGYWVLDPCKPPGTGPGSACDSNDDCCGAPTTAACRIDQPATAPPTRHCVAINPNACNANGGSCSVDADCCDYPTSHCITGTCQPPAPVPNFEDGVYTRDYVGSCPSDTLPVWRFFDWQTITPSDSKIVFSVQTSDTAAGLASAPSVVIGTASGAPTVGWVGANVDDALHAAGLASEQYLRVTMSLYAASDRFSAPTLLDWRQSYSCPPAQ